MNDNILNLAVEAGILDYTTAGGTKPPEYFVPNNVTMVEIERFALSIVHECAEVAWQSYLSDNSKGPGGCATRPIRKHFGVE